MKETNRLRDWFLFSNGWFDWKLNGNNDRYSHLLIYLDNGVIKIIMIFLMQQLMDKKI